MSYRRRLVKAAAAVTAALSGAYVLWACGGGFYLDWNLGDDSLVADAPPAWFTQEIRRLAPPDPSKVVAVLDSEGPYHQTASVEAADLEAALKDSGLPEDERARLLAAYRQQREKVLSYAASMEVWREESWREPRPPEPAPPVLDIPKGFPGEIEDYARGAAAYHLGRNEEAQAAWEKLLARPAAERRRRSTWAAFMLGRMAVEDNPEAAIPWLVRTRELAAEGFPDPLGLAAASLGWQARAELERGRYDEALNLYLEQYWTGDKGARESLRRTCARAAKDPEGLRRVARSPKARAVLTAWVLAGWPKLDLEVEDSLETARTWLAALEATGIRDVDDAERVAWLAYRSGDFAAAGSWLEHARADEPMALWIRAKLLMRSGKLAEAEPLLAQATATLPPGMEEELGDEIWSEPGWSEWGPLSAGRERALHELGALRMARSKYAEALDAMLRGYSWGDAAWVAERVFTISELKAYVEAPPGPGVPESYLLSLQDLLGRRLVRAGRYQEASVYLGADLERLMASLADGRDVRQPRERRAASLFEAACQTRHSGLELQGTELDPDWALGGGSFNASTTIEEREDVKRHPFLPASQDELARARQSAVQPAKTFHYRYRGADLAWEAASLLPDGSEEKARMLAVAGSWIKYLDPLAADRFYKRLVRCCGNTELGRLADERRWFPEVEDCEAGNNPVVEEP